MPQSPKTFAGVWTITTSTLLALSLGGLLALGGSHQGSAAVQMGTPPTQREGSPSAAEERQSEQGILFDLVFFSPRRGLAVGGAGTILTTDDGGRSWQARTLGRDPLRSVTFSDPQTGWIATGLHMYRTQDGGGSWAPYRIERLFSTHGRRVYFRTPQEGWVVGKSVYSTRDGGETWTSRQPFGTVDLWDIACFSADECIAVGSHDTVLTTGDGGVTWSRRSLPILGRHDVLRIRLGPDGTAWVLAHTYGGEVSLARSTDRGQTWTVTNKVIPTLAPSDIYFWNSNRGLVVGTETLLTGDGGVTFQRVERPYRGTPLSSIFFLTKTFGWAVGDYRTILHTQDGGQTWTVQHRE